MDTKKRKKNLSSMKYKLLKNSNCNSKMKTALKTIHTNPKRPLSKLNPWAWWVEITRGCNLRCNFCPTRLFKPGELHFMEKDTWIALLKIIQELTPYSRLELCNAGEPTLHPHFLEFLEIARDICPDLQILTYTNGTQIINKNLTYKQLFDAGLNMVFMDMYAPYKTHVELAGGDKHKWIDNCEYGKGKYYWFYQDKKPKNVPNIFCRQNNPDMHLIMLAENPYNWSRRKLGRGYLQTFFNDLDWPAAKKFGIKPVEKAPSRRCDLPNKFININYDGTYIFCCFDYMRHTINEFGNIKNGLEDFFKFWLGRYMQKTRVKLYNKQRNEHEYCSKCRFTSIRCDVPYWEPSLLSQYWTGEKWKKIQAKFILRVISKKIKRPKLFDLV